ncbi:DUF3800 domain-containing protein [Patescibacteria group bacterium]|nr:MAG: DUF3800 domain-containing protein [Patescibacteria group bacterium]
MEKLYCYVDESGQDTKSEIFVVVAVVSAEEQGVLKEQLNNIEKEVKTNKLKWHKTRRDRRIAYLKLVLAREVAAGDVYIARYRKPIPYFFPVIKLLEKAIKEVAISPYQARVYIDGIDKKKARELTNALRASGVSLRAIKGRRDESEPAIRLADMWAGCARSALLGRADAKEIMARAKKENYLRESGEMKS